MQYRHYQQQHFSPLFLYGFFFNIYYRLKSENNLRHKSRCVSHYDIQYFTQRRKPIGTSTANVQTITIHWCYNLGILQPNPALLRPHCRIAHIPSFGMNSVQSHSLSITRNLLFRQPIFMFTSHTSLRNPCTLGTVLSELS